MVHKMNKLITHYNIESNDTEVNRVHKIINSDGRIYYMKNVIFVQMCGNISNITKLEFMANSEFVIDKNTNELIKCRIPMENLVDSYIQNG